jgi:prepilin-type N-terminal cleavage/methylation domain-containing protein
VAVPPPQHWASPGEVCESSTVPRAGTGAFRLLVKRLLKRLASRPRQHRLSRMRYAGRLNHGNRTCAFTLCELLVVLAVLSLLALMVLPALANSERTRRAVCQNNLRQLALGVTVYAGNYGGMLFAARSQTVQIALDPPNAFAAGTVGLHVGTNDSVWTCPNRPSLPIYDPVLQWIIGYQYFGGIAQWQNPAGTFPSRSPVNLGSAQPHWTIAADAVMKISGVWGGQNSDPAYKDMPPHRTADSFVPQGGNQAFVDGSVQWIPFEQMYFLHSWSPTARAAYFYQNPKDFPAQLQPVLSVLRAQP